MANWYDDVPAPVDSNGRDVPLDTKELVYKGERREVLRIAYSVAIGRWVADLANTDLANTDEHPFLTHCTLPDSWERLDEDAAKGLCGYFGMDDAPECKGCPAYGVRLSTGCSSVMTRDIIRRAKALAGVTDGE